MVTKIKTFGGFDMRINGDSVLKNNGRTSKNMELLKYFITHRNRKLVPEQIINSLWPEGELVNPKNALRTQIFRLRKNLFAMGLATSDNTKAGLDIVFDNGFYLTVVGDNFQVDTDQFTSCVQEADYLRETDPENAIEIYRKIVNIYQGVYLAENPLSEWIFTTRNRFHRQFIHSVLKLLGLLKSKGAFEEIVDVYEQTVIHEPYEEALHIHYLEALVRLKDYKTALSYYNFITGKMYNERYIQPSPVLRSIYQEIRAEGKENESSSLMQIRESFMGKDTLDGAMYCDLDYFKTIYRFEYRKVLRTGDPVFLGVITIDKKNGRLTDRDSKYANGILKEILFYTLRKDDVFSQLQAGRLVVLFTGVAEKNLQYVTQRIIQKFKDKMITDKIFLKIAFQLIATKESFITQGV